MFKKGMIGTGKCQSFVNYDFFDLNDLDMMGRDKAASKPALIEADAGMSFWYKSC